LFLLVSLTGALAFGPLPLGFSVCLVQGLGGALAGRLFLVAALTWFGRRQVQYKVNSSEQYVYIYIYVTYFSVRFLLVEEYWRD
jgi:hypothetical protein